MPNWCSNRLIIKGMSFKKFKELYYENEQFSFEKVIPIGEWEYEKACEKWGTKWDCNDTDDYCNDDDDELLEISFSTAWSPPELVIEKLRENHPEADVKLLYCEPGCDFCGINGNDIQEDYAFSENSFKGWDEDLKSYIEEEREGCSFIVDEEYFEED